MPQKNMTLELHFEFSKVQIYLMTLAFAEKIGFTFAYIISAAIDESEIKQSKK